MRLGLQAGARDHGVMIRQPAAGLPTPAPL